MGESPRRGLPGRWLAVAVALAPPLTLLSQSAELPADIRIKGAALWTLSMLPAVSYAFRRPSRREPAPMFPVIGLVFGIYYALPAMVGAVNMAYKPVQIGIPYLDPATAYESPVELALWGWVCTLLGYWAAALFRPARRRSAPEWTFSELAPALTALVVAGLGAEALQTVVRLPVVIGGIVAFGGVINRFAIAMLVAGRAQGLLSPRGRLVMAIAIPLELVLLLASGSIAKVLLFVLLLLAAQYMAGGRIRPSWLAGGLVATAALITLKGVLTEYRREAWFGGRELGVSERVALMGDLVDKRVEEQGVLGAVESGFITAAARSATLDLLADAMLRTPKEIPYWGGSTYLSLVGFAIPRVLWPSKPTKNLGQDYGHRYSYLDPRDTFTSVNFPFMIEFYANFGEFGVLIGMFLVGVIYRVLDFVYNVPGQGIVRSLVGVSIMLPLLNIESDFSLVFGGLFLNAVAFNLLLIMIRRYLRKRARGGAPGRAAAGAWQETRG